MMKIFLFISLLSLLAPYKYPGVSYDCSGYPPRNPLGMHALGANNHCIKTFNNCSAGQSFGRNLSQTCPDGRWGADCMNICGDCSVFILAANQSVCDPNNGTCTSGKCLVGYSGPKCDQAICPNGCGSGKCIAPGLCGFCYSRHQVTPDCTDIRLRGLAGSVIAFAVITASFSMCGLASEIYSRKMPRSF